MTVGPVRVARLNGVPQHDRERVARYLPTNYAIVTVENYVEPTADDSPLLIVGVDVAGWTLDDYVIPRLASGCIYATEEQP